MLDEPAQRPHPRRGRRARRRSISGLRDDFNLTVLLVEHHMAMVMGISDNVVVLDFGRKIAEGTPSEVAARPEGDRGLPGDGGMSDTDGRRHERCLRRSSDAAGQLRAGARCCTASTFEVHDGEVVVILGANGAGKTTTLRAICQMVNDAGRRSTSTARSIDRQVHHRRSCGGASPTCPRVAARSPTSACDDNLARRRLRPQGPRHRRRHRPVVRRRSRGWPSGGRSSPAASAAASSRCSPSPGP